MLQRLFTRNFAPSGATGTGHVVLDHTPIGDVAEIEGEPDWIDRTAQALGVHPADYITKSYIELFFEWKRKTNRKAENMTFQRLARWQPNRKPERHEGCSPSIRNRS